MIKCGVNRNVYSPYNFEDHIWTLPAQRRDDLLELAHRCIKFDKNYWMRLPNSAVWTAFNMNSDAKKAAKNQWMHGRLKNGNIIDGDLIDTFFDGIEQHTVTINKKTFSKDVEVGSCPYVHGMMVIPMGPQFVTYCGRQYLNSSTIEVMVGDERYVMQGKLITAMIYRALCNGDELDTDKAREADLVYGQIVSDTYTNQDFRFVMNWLAAIYQNPGINLQTNLWLIGSLQGVGKGTILTLMKHILGHDAVGTLNQSEIESGWSDHLFSKLLVEVNEFDASEKWSGRRWDKWIKAHCCEPELNIRQRNCTAYDTLNVGNYMFTTNEELPIYLDKTDRRNQIIKGTTDAYWREWASLIQTTYVIADPLSVAGGFAAILDKVKVDFNFIKSAYVNQAKADIQDHGITKTEEWVRNDHTIDREKWRDVRDWYAKFVAWHHNDYPGDKNIPSRNRWSRDMKRIAFVQHAPIGSDEVGRRRVPEYRIGHPRATPSSDRNVVMKDFHAFTDADIIPILDQQVVHDAPATTSSAKLYRLKAALRRDATGD